MPKRRREGSLLVCRSPPRVYLDPAVAYLHAVVALHLFEGAVLRDVGAAAAVAAGQFDDAVAERPDLGGVHLVVRRRRRREDGRLAFLQEPHEREDALPELVLVGLDVPELRDRVDHDPVGVDVPDGLGDVRGVAVPFNLAGFDQVVGVVLGKEVRIRADVEELVVRDVGADRGAVGVYLLARLLAVDEKHPVVLQPLLEEAHSEYRLPGAGFAVDQVHPARDESPCSIRSSPSTPLLKGAPSNVMSLNNTVGTMNLSEEPASSGQRARERLRTPRCRPRDLAERPADPSSRRSSLQLFEIERTTTIASKTASI